MLIADHWCPGTPEYLSPEVIQSKGHGKAVDWWALGVLIYEMSCGFPPFYDNSPFAIYEKIVAGRISFPSLVPEETKDIVRKLCTRDLSARLGNMRGGGHQVMAHRFFDGIDWQELESQINPVCPIVLSRVTRRHCEVTIANRHLCNTRVL